MEEEKEERGEEVQKKTREYRRKERQNEVVVRADYLEETPQDNGERETERQRESALRVGFPKGRVSEVTIRQRMELDYDS